MFIFERRRRIHWLDGGTVACGAKLSRDQFETLAADGTKRVTVTCPKCAASLRRRIAQFSDPGSDEDCDILKALESLL